MRLRDLLRDLPVAIVDTDPEVSGLQHDSRRVGPGDLYVALPGATFDGRDFAVQAEAGGAVAVLGRGEAPDGIRVPWIAAEDPRALLAPLSARVYGHPERRLRLVGVTGTNGKTTVVALVQALLESAGHPCGRLGTLGIRFGDWSESSARTTPEAPEIYRALEAMADRGAVAAVLEVSSHALDLGRVDGLAFEVAVFTNLTRDHLDHHGDLDSYFAVKRKLFDRLTPDGVAVIAVDDPRGAELARDLRATGRRVVACGPGGDLELRETTSTVEGLRIVVGSSEGTFEVRSALRGFWNATNLLLAAGVGRALGLAEADVARGLGSLGPLTGRMEPVDAGQDFPVFVDFAHTPAALEAAVRSLREMVGESGRLAVVFGCGGDKDPGKRAPMGEIVGRWADLPIATSDNPRSEDPVKILGAIEDGLRASGNERFRIVPDRRDAIRRAVRVATRGAAGGERWAVLVAGKGHETTQTVGSRILEFSDREELVAAIEGRRDGRA